MSARDDTPAADFDDAAVFDALPSGCLVVDGSGGILRANDTLARWLGRPAAALARRHFSDLLTVGGKLYYVTKHRVVEELEGEVHEVSYSLRHADGSGVPVLVSTRSLSGGKRIYLVFRAKLRRLYEAQLLESKKAAEEANRARETFLNTVSHEVRTPVHGLIGIADLLRSTRLDEQQRRLVDMLVSSGDALLALVNDVLDLSRADSSQLEVHPRPTDLHALVDGVLCALRSAVDEGDVALEHVFGLSAPRYVEVDAGKLRQILTNLVSNALKFTDKGHVRVHLGGETLREGRARVRLSVEDTGGGIPAHEFATVFAPFGQASGAELTTGTGLGLPISQRLARALGGEIALESEVGRGSTFSLTLEVPAAAAQRLPGHEAAVHEGDDAGEVSLVGLRALVVDDNLTNLLIARRHLRALGVDVAEASDGRRAIEVARGASFDVVLLDLRMPGLDGYATAEALRRLPGHADTLLIAVSAASYGIKRDRARDLGFAAHLLKPFTPEQLRLTLAEHVSPPGGGIDASALRDHFGDADDDRGELAELLGIMAGDLRGERPALVAAARTGDVEAVGDSRHRLASILRLLRPRPLASLLDDAVDGEALAQDPRALAQLAARIGAAVDGAAAAVDGYRAGLPSLSHAPQPAGTHLR